MWNEQTFAIPARTRTPPSSPQSTWACAPGTTSNRRCSPRSGFSSPASSSAAIRGLAPATYTFTR